MRSGCHDAKLCSRGLGRAAVIELAKGGIDSIFTYHSNAAEASEVVRLVESHGRRAIALQLDVGQVGTFPAFVAKVKEALKNSWNVVAFDFLVNNAGVGRHELFAEATEAGFDALCNVHFKGPFFLTQALLPLLKDGGRILNISSGLTRFTLPGYSAYASMKAAMEVLTRYQAKELGARRISVNILAPGAIETDFGGGTVRDNAQVNRFIASNTALGRVGKPDDIGPLVAALLSPPTGWINGQRIEASGGQFI
jgi:NAD(P)-dependent dehydrogenase (short-subunit alcohol dehydrogenase family)